MFVTDNKIWQTDGTSTGTTVLFDIDTMEHGRSTSSITAVGNSLFVVVPLYNSANRAAVPRPNPGPIPPSAYALVKIDGSTKAATVLLTTKNPIQSPTSADGVLYFGQSNAVWKSDGTVAGTQEIRLLTANVSQLASLPGTSRLIYRGNDSDFVTVTGLINPATGCAVPSVVANLYFSDLSAAGLVPIGDEIYFSANDGTRGVELWRAPRTAFDAPPSLDPASAFIHTGSTANIRLRACDVEDTPLTFAVLTQPAHG